MLRVLVERFWPVLLPVLCYMLWLALARRKARKNGDAIPKFFDGPWLWPVLASLILAISGFIYMGITASGLSEGHYVPAKVVDGRIVPAHNESEP